MSEFLAQRSKPHQSAGFSCSLPEALQEAYAPKDQLKELPCEHRFHEGPKNSSIARFLIQFFVLIYFRPFLTLFCRLFHYVFLLYCLFFCVGGVRCLFRWLVVLCWLSR